MKRLRPAVEAPYGMPLKLLTPFAATPRTLPHAVSTIGYADDSLGIEAAVMVEPSLDGSQSICHVSAHQGNRKLKPRS